MAGKAKGGATAWHPVKVKKTTSIGKSTQSRPKNKNQKRSWKKYRGQGK